MKLIFLLMIFCSTVFCEALPDRRDKSRVKKKEYYFKDYHAEEGKFGEERYVGYKTYDSEGNKIEERRKYTKEIEEVVKFTFDSDNRLKEIDLENEKQGEEKKVVHHYDGDKVTEKIIYKGDKLVDKEKRTFDSEGKLIRVENKRGEVTDYHYDKKGRIVMKADGVVKNHYSYDNNRIVKDMCEVDGKPIYFKEFTYDSKGRVEKFTETILEDSGKERKKETVYKYNDKGDKVEERWRENNSAGWHIRRMENKYNENGDLIEVKEFETKETGEEVPRRMHHYRYEYY